MSNRQLPPSERQAVIARTSKQLLARYAREDQPLTVQVMDANVLYPEPIRDILMQLAVEDLFWAKWTTDIHRERIEALLRHEPHRGRVALERPH